MVVFPVMLTGTACVVTVFAFAEHSAWCLVLIALTVVFYAMRFSAFAPFFHLLQFEPQTEGQI